MKLQITKHDDGYWLDIGESASILLESNSSIVMQAIKDASEADAADEPSAEEHVKPWCAEEFAKDFLRAWVNTTDEKEAIAKMIRLIEADRAAQRQAGREEAEESLSSLIELAEEVKQWSEAYPTDIFSEPTPEQIDEVCKVLGFRIDNISAMVLRAFTKPWGDKARRALSDLNEARKG